MTAQAEMLRRELADLYGRMIVNDWTAGVVEVAPASTNGPFAAVDSTDGFRVVLQRKPGSRTCRITEGLQELNEFIDAEPNQSQTK